VGPAREADRVTGAHGLALLVAYDGTAYHGWQIQPGVRTIQGAITAALAPLAGAEVRLTAASRTDARVHALGQVASLRADRRVEPAVARAALNATLPRDVRILAARDVPAGFDARRAARLKRYAYLLEVRAVASPFWRRYAWPVGRDLDLAAMRVALRQLRGCHDFSAFCAAAGRDRDPVCTVRSGRVTRRGDLVAVVVSADAFLHHMVRNLVGTLVEVGRGRREPAWVGEVLGSRDRRRAGPTAPPGGLFLASVRYPFPLFPGGRRLAGAPALTASLPR
jgi:tRNA pseudouridine38-40 synthase